MEWRRLESNQRPTGYESVALTTELRRRGRATGACGATAGAGGCALGSPLGTSLSARSHQRVSRWGVCLPHQRQYLLNSIRSGSFRFDFIVW